MEQQLLGWHFESSDDEGFQVVMSRSLKKKKKKRVTFCGNKEKYLMSPLETTDEKNGTTKISSKVVSKRGNKAKNSK